VAAVFIDFLTAPGAQPYKELHPRHEFAQLFSGKSIKTAATRAALFDYIMHQIVLIIFVRID